MRISKKQGRDSGASLTGVGTTVIIADNKSAPSHTVRPGMVFSGKTGTPPAGGFVWAPEKTPKGPVSVAAEFSGSAR
jgi:hypothetical protein